MGKKTLSVLIYGSKNGCARTDTVFYPISEVCNGNVSLSNKGVCRTILFFLMDFLDSFGFFCGFKKKNLLFSFFCGICGFFLDFSDFGGQ